MNINRVLVILLITANVRIWTLSSKPVYITPSNRYHIVNKDETLYEIGQKYGITLDKLIIFNELKSERVYQGQKIYLEPHPVTKSEFITIRALPSCGYHIVSEGETIHTISKMYDLNMIDLIDFNRLETTSLKKNQKIFLRNNVENIEVEADVPNQEVISKPEVKEIVPMEQQTRKIKPTKKDKIIIPVEGMVSSEFGLRNGNPHKGIDIAGPLGSPIHAVLDGQVVYSGNQRGYGNVIILEHEDYIMTVYAHNDANLVRLGDKVKQGQPIATLGQTGTTSGPHLHFEYRIKGKAVNPRQVLPSLK
ncbi:MAG: peptidoglycan DD-metalloendopeptidase family protein [Candidatus Cloacimonetes bacterium]|nr:peptidoglycan DD-metalloendopeptidase family protein [Candidatus Cloacimonadota bacterium]